MNARAALKEGSNLLGGAYLVNAALAGGLAVAGYFCGAAIFWPLFVIAFFFSIFIAVIRTPPLKRWISRCYFSLDLIESKNIYSSLDEELVAFNGAIGS